MIESFPQFLIDRRNAKRWKRKRVAKELSVSVQTIGQWERGETQPNALNALGLARVLDIPHAEMEAALKEEQ